MSAGVNFGVLPRGKAEKQAALSRLVIKHIRQGTGDHASLLKPA
jgi:hypothetical protein